MKSNKDVAQMMSEFFKPIRAEKEAAENVANEAKGVVGEPGKEETADLEKGLGDVESAAKASKPESADPGDNVGAVDADDSVNKQQIGYQETKDPSEDIEVLDKKAYLRNARLADRILQTLEKEASARPTTVMEKLAALKGAKGMEKEAAVYWYKRGQEQRQQDVSELVSTGMTKEAANALLDKIANEDPDAVAPPEAIGDEDVQMAEEAAAVQELLEAGVSPEEIMEAAGITEEDVVQALAEAGIGPEELEAMAAQGGAPEMAPEMAPEAGGSPEEQAIEELLAAGVPPEEIEQALMG